MIVSQSLNVPFSLNVAWQIIAKLDFFSLLECGKPGTAHKVYGRSGAVRCFTLPCRPQLIFEVRQWDRYKRIQVICHHEHKESAAERLHGVFIRWVKPNLTEVSICYEGPTESWWNSLFLPLIKRKIAKRISLTLEAIRSEGDTLIEQNPALVIPPSR